MADSEPTGGALRNVLLGGLAILLTIALLALAVAMLVWLPRAPSPGPLLASLLSLIVADVALVLLFGDYLLRRLFVRPVGEMVEQAEAIARGDATRRLRPSGAEELRRLAESVNSMADRLILHQQRLRENIRSLDATNRELSLARRELVQAEKLATVGRLAAGIAHEIGNPLGSILGYLEVARRRGNGAEQEWLEGIAREAARIDRVVRGLLDFARPKPSREREIVVNDAVREAVDLLRSQGRFKRVRLDLELAEPTPIVRGDPGHFEQILVNLVLNAGDAIDEAGAPGRIVIRTGTAPFEPPRGLEPPRRADDPEGIDYSHLRSHRTEPEAHHRFELGEGVVRVEVWDDGVGIDPDDLPSIFEPFYTTKEPGRGTGLGLAVSGRLAEEMGGALTATSRPREGTSFALLLPRAHGESASAEGAA